MLTLHVTNGDHAAQGLRRSGLEGDVLVWKDVLHDGPVPPDIDRAAFRVTRAQFLAERGWADAEEVVADLTSRDDRLDATSSADHVVLWFEPDLFDQLQLIQVLARFQHRPQVERPQVSIVPADLMLGPLAPDQFPALHEARRSIGLDDFARGEAAWNAFTSSTPGALEALVDALDREIVARSFASDHHVRLPHLTAALRRLLEEYPGAETGLSRSERQIAQALDEGVSTLGQLFQASHAPCEAWTWLGDSSFAWYVQRLSTTTTPLMEREDGAPVGAMIPGQDGQAFWEQRVVLTAFGLDVLAGRAEAIGVNGIDRWVGGVHMTSSRYWRWNRRTQRLEPAGGSQ